MSEIKITSTPVKMEPRKLKAKWDVKMSDDLMAYHNVGISSRGLADAIDKDIFEKLMKRSVPLRKGGSVFLG